jgi:hypothetical protein
MAIIHGDGSQANPWIVDNWTDFQTVNVGGNRSKYVQFASPHKDYTSGTITLSGDGSYQNPKVVSSYEELLFATGATAVWQPKLVDDETHDNLYYYKAENAETGIYCLYDSSLSTIDFDTLYQSGINDTIYLESINDFNGWTLLNMRFVNTSGNVQNDFYSSYQYSTLNKVRILNYQSLSNCPFAVQIDDSIIQGAINSTRSGGLFRSPQEWQRTINCSSIVIDANYSGNGFHFMYYSATLTVNDSRLIINVKASDWIGDDSKSEINLNNSVMQGEWNTDVYATKLFKSVTNSILDFSSVGATFNKNPDGNCTGSVFNSEKMSLSKSGLVGVTSAQLLSPTALQAAGLPIGVDEDASD